MARRKAKYPTDSRFAPRNQQVIPVNSSLGSVRQKCRIVIVENKGARVVRIVCACSALIARAHIAARVITRWNLLLYLLQLTLPRALSPMGRDQNPCPRQGIEATVGCSFQIQASHICDASPSFDIWEDAPDATPTCCAQFLQGRDVGVRSRNAGTFGRNLPTVSTTRSHDARRSLYSTPATSCLTIMLQITKRTLVGNWRCVASSDRQSSINAWPCLPKHETT